MITINKSILHILDFNSNITVFSEGELDLDNNSIITFLNKHLERSFSDANLKPGNFLEESKFKKHMEDYKNKDLDFIPFSRTIAQMIYSSISQSDMMDSLDLIVCDLNIEEDHFIGILLCTNRVGFTHQVINDNGSVKNEIINHYAILPSLSQKLDGYAFIDVNSLKIKFTDKNRNINGQETYIIPDIVLQCDSSISQRDVVKLLNTVTLMVAENHGENSAIAISKAKNYIAETIEEAEHIEPLELGKAVFNSSKLMQDEFIREAKNIGIPETVKMDKAFAQRTGKNHKIKTDTGIEISFPVDYFENKEYIEFINNPNGTLSIELRNIGKITNK